MRTGLKRVKTELMRAVYLLVYFRASDCIASDPNCTRSPKASFGLSRTSEGKYQYDFVAKSVNLGVHGWGSRSKASDRLDGGGNKHDVELPSARKWRLLRLLRNVAVRPSPALPHDQLLARTHRPVH